MLKWRTANLPPARKIIPIIGAIFLILNLYIKIPFLGCAAFIAYFLSLSYCVGRQLNPDDPSIHKFTWGGLTLLSGLVILLSLAYYIYKLDNIVIGVCTTLPLVLLLSGDKTQTTTKILAICHLPARIKIYALAALALAADIMLLAVLFLKRTDSLLASPWQFLDPWFFLTYAAITAILFYFYFNWQNTRGLAILSAAHLFLTFSIAAIIYKLGFGFDAFVHRATEEWILQNGLILPKQPYYIGQYSLVVFLAKILAVPLFYIDVWLVPTLSAMALPAVFLSVLNLSYGKPYRFGLAAVWIIPFLPLLTLHLTTPHNLTLLLSIITILATVAYLENKIHWIVIISLSLAAAFSHPLAGAPLCLFAMSSILVKKINGIKFLKSKKPLFMAGLLYISSSLLLPVLFILNNLRVGAKMPVFANPLTKIPRFLELFQRPYWYANHSPFIFFELLYFLERLIVPVFIAAAIVGFILHMRKFVDKRYLIFIASALGLCTSALLLRSWIIFPDVVTYEQGDYPLRLLRTSLLFLLPGAIYFAGAAFNFISNLRAKKYLFIGSLVLIGIALMLSLYLSYPQRNAKVRFPGYNVTASDMKAVEWIHDQSKDYDYIVLSDQLVSAAALTKYSFAKYFSTPRGELFYYSIPTGGTLYQYYGKMIYEGQKREYMEEAMRVAGTRKAYFVVNSYWANSTAIVENAKKTADFNENIDNGNVWILGYKLPLDR